MNRKQRDTLAKRLTAIARKHGARTRYEDFGRDGRIVAHWPGVSVSADIDGQDGVLFHWHDARQAIRPDFADSVNECHGRKATLYGDDADQAATKFAACCARVADGTAFQESEQ